MGNHAVRRVHRKHDNWYYLEKLPPRLRQALCNAAFTWDAKWFYDNWNKGKSVDWCISEIKRWDLHALKLSNCTHAQNNNVDLFP
jgi:hypothetical protein